MIVNRDERRGRATSFALVADAYERARPGYPDEAVRWLAGPTPCDVVDLGAGTGKLTRSLVALEHRVTAVEPLQEMLDRLRRTVPDAVALAGGAEAIPLGDASADVVVCAQAFHWFDHAVALPEIARVLRPGGRLALVWNTRDDREPWVATLSEAVIGRETVEDRDAAAPLASSELFEPVERATFSLVQRLDRDTLLDLVLSRSYCAVQTEAERAPVLARAGRVFDEHARDGVIELPYLTECFRARRRG
ncbi:MAG TPA: methyltransferase domain-containing protein [Gaiella sp.]